MKHEVEKVFKQTNILYSDLKTVKELVFDPCGYVLKNLTIHTEGNAYSACSYELEGKAIEYRTSKITPLKTGQFVTIWTRNKQRITQPFDSSDKLDFIIISSGKDDNFGLFIFPKSVLLSKGIISQKGEGGKRGIRVYPPWDMYQINRQKKLKAGRKNISSGLKTISKAILN
ncbi:MepB family protein [Daejeonella sp.]|uniref:MepB family protein n=1 Tax=Daejeonella sp. TaxID=2805397 RepID=UPI0026C1DEF8|nr:MepB family protein [Daejeonella sp.]HQT23255.1 MepB family protein [Daejeonella sp.]HQT58207.1 MepB family protein [Daejeonella sp.]